ncbi:hypothetical protein KM043_004250 [Ampulex compressa]|nr:hypothetical protein KM043_004250 [Ampulex compressa]
MWDVSTPASAIHLGHLCPTFEPPSFQLTPAFVSRSASPPPTPRIPRKTPEEHLTPVRFQPTHLPHLEGYSLSILSSDFHPKAAQPTYCGHVPRNRGGRIPPGELWPSSAGQRLEAELREALLSIAISRSTMKSGYDWASGGSSWCLALQEEEDGSRRSVLPAFARPSFCRGRDSGDVWSVTEQAPHRKRAGVAPTTRDGATIDCSDKNSELERTLGIKVPFIPPWIYGCVWSLVDRRFDECP